MKIKLTPIPAKNTPKNKYLIEVEFMHGDADHYDTESFKCDEDEFKRVMANAKNIPQSPGSGGDEEVYDDWCEKTFGIDFVPYDKTTNCSIRACIDGIKGFYYDENGTKFKAELDPNE